MRYIPNWSRRSVVPTVSSSPGGAHRYTSVPLSRKISRPPGRSSRAASGTHLYGSAQRHAPYSETARSNDASGSGTSSAGASTSGNSRPVSSIIRRAVASCAGVGSTPVPPAPRRRGEPRAEVRGAAAELDDVEPVHARERPDLLLGDREDTPEDPF